MKQVFAEAPDKSKEGEEGKETTRPAHGLNGDGNGGEEEDGRV